MKLDFKWSRLDSLSVLELFEIIKARESVFVVEQQCAYQETDDMDLHAWHLAVTVNDELAAYARIVDPGMRYDQPSIGRVMTVRKFRKMTIGRTLMDEAIGFTEKQFPGMEIKISAQVYLQNFYESFGFVAINDVYDEDGIPHIDMVRSSINTD